jgi:hypothetical protein
MSLEELMTRLSENVLIRFGEDGELRAPVWMMQTQSGQLIVVMTPIDRDTDRDMVAEAMRTLFKEHKAKRYAFAMEMWFAVDRDTVRNSTRPSQRPDRREGVLISGEDCNGETRSVMHEIDRSSGAPVLKAAELFGGFGGRFWNLLDQNAEH